MDLLKFVLWLSIGAIIGWFAGRLTKLEHSRIPATITVED